MKERLFIWIKKAKRALRRRWWWWPVLFIGQQIWEVTKHRIYGDINSAIDAHSDKYLQGAKPFLLYLVTNPVLLPLLIFVAVMCAILLHAYLDTLPSKIGADEMKTTRTPEDTKTVENTLVSEVSNIPIAVGLTFEGAEVEILPDSSQAGFKFKLRVYLANYSGQQVHLGVPIWTEGIPAQGHPLTYFYQPRRQHNQENPWGDEVKEVDLSAGQRCRIWLGLDPAQKGDALKRLEEAGLGLLVIPVKTPTYLVDVRIRPSDRGLTRFDAQQYNAQKKAVYDRYISLSQEAKALLSLIRIRRVLSEADVIKHFQQYELPNPDKTLSDLRNDSVPFLASMGPEIKLNPILEKVISETVKADDAEFLKATEKLTGDAFGNRIKHESGFKGRFNALASKQLS